MNNKTWPQYLIGKYKNILQSQELQQQIQNSNLKGLKELINNKQLDSNSLDSLQELDVVQLEKFYQLSKQNDYLNKKYDGFKPLRDDQVINKNDLQNIDQLQSIGLEQIAKGKCGLILLAGGDGRRLGFQHPKMLYPVNLNDSKTLIEVFIKRIISLQKLAYKKYPQYKNTNRDSMIIYIVIQSSKQKQIKEYFEYNNYFGYKTIVFVKTEQDINLIDENGDIIFDQDQKVIKSSMGNGDLISALNHSILDHMKQYGLDYIQISGIDNLLFKPLDPIFLGFTIFNKFKLSFKTVEKIEPKENVGIHGINTTGYNVYEYIHMDIDKRSIKNQDDTLYFKYAHLLNLISTTEALEQMCSQQKNFQIFNFVERPFDVYDFKNKKIIKDKKCLKVEWFFMDYYQFVKEQGFLNVNREEEFQAIKSKDGMNTPEQALLALKNYYKKIQQQNKKNIIDYLPEINYYDEENQIKKL